MGGGTFWQVAFWSVVFTIFSTSIAVVTNSLSLGVLYGVVISAVLFSFLNRFIGFQTPTSLPTLYLTVPVLHMRDTPNVVFIHQKKSEIYKHKKKNGALKNNPLSLKARKNLNEPLFNELVQAIQLAYKLHIYTVVVASHMIKGSRRISKLMEQVKLIDPNVQIEIRKMNLPVPNKIMFYVITGNWIKKPITEIKFSFTDGWLR